MTATAPDQTTLTRRAERVRDHRDPTTPATRVDQFLYHVAWWLLRGLCRAWFRVEVVGREKVPEGAFVVAPVHRSYLDFALVSGILPPGRRLRYLAKDTLWSGWWGRLWDALGAIPVHRGTPDREALRACVAVVEAGEPVVMFPEGTRQHGPRLAELFDGPAFVQARTGVPVLPVGVGGSEAAMPRGSKFPKRHKIVVLVGEALGAPEPTPSGVVRRSALRDQTARLRDEVQRLFDDAQERAGSPNR